MKQTRRLQIRRKKFRIDDLKRIAELYDRQSKLAKKSNHHYYVNYAFHFADDTSYESDSPSIFDDPEIQVKRPVKVEYHYSNYQMERRMSVSITHGHSGYGNELSIQANDSSWVNDNFAKLESFINGTESQSFWFSKHPYVLCNLLALGLGSLAIYLMTYIFSMIGILQIDFDQPGYEKLKSFRIYVKANPLLYYAFIYFWRWFTGWFVGAVSITDWVLSAWPNIELDFGPDHLKAEKMKRNRIVVFTTLVVIPVLLSIVQDVFRSIACA